MIFGSNIYLEIAEYWENTEKSSAKPLERELAEKLNEKKKYVISRLDVEITCKNFYLMKIDDI